MLKFSGTLAPTGSFALAVTVITRGSLLIRSTLGWPGSLEVPVTVITIGSLGGYSPLIVFGSLDPPVTVAVHGSLCTFSTLALRGFLFSKFAVDGFDFGTNCLFIPPFPHCLVLSDFLFHMGIERRILLMASGALVLAVDRFG